MEKFLIFNCLHDKYGFSQAVTPRILFAKSKFESTLRRHILNILRGAAKLGMSQSQLWSLWMRQVLQESQNAAAPVSLLLATGGQGHAQAILHLRARQQHIYIYTYIYDSIYDICTNTKVYMYICKMICVYVHIYTYL